MPGFSSTGPRSVNDWSADLVGHGGMGQAEIPCSNWRTPLTEHHRRSRVNTLRCSPPRGELALMPTVTGRVAATDQQGGVADEDMLPGSSVYSNA